MMLASVKSGEPTAEIKKIAESLPPAWDWRNVNGTNFVGPVRDQMRCGSCYAWAALGMLESRIRIVSNNRLNVSLSVQDVVEFSPYSQGCSGGFPYLVGKYAEDFGLVHENCNPYTVYKRRWNQAVRFASNTLINAGRFRELRSLPVDESCGPVGRLRRR